MGIKIGRYHVYLPKMLKPKAVEFQSLFEVFNSLTEKQEIPKFGLNFIINKHYEKAFFYCVVLKNLKTILLEQIFQKSYL